MNWINGVLAAIKLPTKIISGICLFAFVLISLPLNITKQLGLDVFINLNKSNISLIFLGSLVFLIVNIFLYLIKKVSITINNFNEKKDIEVRINIAKKYIENLDSIEKGILWEFIIFEKNSIELPITNASVSTLIKNNILIITADYRKKTIFGSLTACKINEHVISIIQPKHLGIEKDNFESITHNEVNHLYNSRPNFLLELEKFRKYLG